MRGTSAQASGDAPVEHGDIARGLFGRLFRGSPRWMGHACGLMLALLGTALALPADSAHAHGGGLDRYGCHTQRSTGEYHCHRSAAPPSTPAHGASTLAPTRAGGAFANCAEARAAGAAPVRRGEPGYGPHLDRDGDGVGCEPRR